MPKPRSNVTPLPTGTTTRRGGAGGANVPPPTHTRLRRDKVALLLCQGHRPGAVVAKISEEFGVSERVVEEDIGRVRDQWAAEAAEERPRAREEMLAKIDAAHIAALDDGKHGDCARLLKLRAEVQGLVGPRNVAIAVSSAEALTEEEIRDRAAALLRRARERVAGGVGSPDGG